MNSLQQMRQKLNQILIERDKTFPIRDPQNTQAMRVAAAEYVTGLRETLEPDWQPDPELVDKATRIMEHPVFICGHMKSGTTLLTNLLDGHPNLVVMPGDSHFVDFTQNRGRFYQKIASTYNSPYSGSLKDWDTFWTFRLISPTGQKPYWILGDDDRPYLDFIHYLDFWLTRLPTSARNNFVAVVLAFYCANPNRPVSPQLWVEKTPGNEKWVEDIEKWFPEARFVHIVRDPYANLASLKRLSHHRGRRWQVESYAFGIRRSMEAALTNQQQLGPDRYHVLRYVDLTDNLEVETEKLAHFLGISFVKSMLQPTINGGAALSNSMYRSRKVEGQVLNQPSPMWQKELTTNAQKVSEAIVAEPAQKLGYKKYQTNNIRLFWAKLRQLQFRVSNRLSQVRFFPTNLWLFNNL